MSKTDQNLEYSTIVSVAQTLEAAFKECGTSQDRIIYESLSVFINQVYGTRNRSFHDIFHAIEVGQGCNGIGKLAALFHDVVYIQVDRSRTEGLRKCFGIFDPKEKLELTIPSEEVLNKTPFAQSICALFEVLPGETLRPLTGLNEFLSTWVMIQKLHSFFPAKTILSIACCIEATIPFRTKTLDDLTIPQWSEIKLINASALENTLFQEDEIRAVVSESVRVSNNDVAGFGMEEPDVFIYNSWALLYEGNPSLQNSFYTLSSYKEALLKLQFFLESMSPRKIFRSYEPYISFHSIEKWIEGAGKNLRISREYVKAKILDTVLLQGFTELTGGDCPLELLTGPKPKNRESKTARIETFLNWEFTLSKDFRNKDEFVLRLLSEGRAFRSRFDLKTSLFAAYLYQRLSQEEFYYLFETAEEYLKKEISAEEFLSTFPSDLIQNVGQTLSKLAWTREQSLLEVTERLSKKEMKVA